MRDLERRISFIIDRKNGNLYIELYRDRISIRINDVTICMLNDHFQEIVKTIEENIEYVTSSNTVRDVVKV